MLLVLIGFPFRARRPPFVVNPHHPDVGFPSAHGTSPLWALNQMYLYHWVFDSGEMPPGEKNAGIVHLRVVFDTKTWAAGQHHSFWLR
jgi:hypothetical protein